MAVKKRKTVLQKHLAKIASKGGKTTLERYGNDHFRNLVKKRWEEKKKLVS